MDQHMQKSNDLWFQFGYKILEIVDQSEQTSPGAIERLKRHYAIMQDHDIQEEISNFCKKHKIKYRFEFGPTNDYQIIFYKGKKVLASNCNEDIILGLVSGIIQVYDLLTVNYYAPEGNVASFLLLEKNF